MKLKLDDNRAAVNLHVQKYVSITVLMMAVTVAVVMMITR